MGEALVYSFPGRFDRVAEMCGVIAAEAEHVGFNADEVFRIELACDEACTNIIQHAYGQEDVGDIQIILKKTDDALIIILKDRGKRFNPEEVPLPTFPTDSTNIDDLKIGGLGLHFMRTIMDEVRYAVDGEGQNELVMIKYITRTPNR